MSITLQPWKLKLLSIPKSYPQSITGCTHAIVKNIFFPRSRDTLFSFTQNALELAIVADVEVIAEDFMSLKLEGMMVTDDVFCAFMVDDPDGIDNSGRRINELSALLSRNGISIFYLSTRITDLILVKEKRLKSVLPTIRSLFSLSVDSDCDLSSRGFTSESDMGSFPGSSFTSMNSFLHTPSSPSRYQSVHYQYPNTNNNNNNHNNNGVNGNSYTSAQQSSALFGSSLSGSYTRPSTGITIPFGRRPSYGNFSRGGPGLGAGGVTESFFGRGARPVTDSESSSMDGSGSGSVTQGLASSIGMMSMGHSQAQHIQQRQQQGRQPSIAESSFGDGIGRYFPKRHAQGSSIDSFDSASRPMGPSVSDNNLRMTFSSRDCRPGTGNGGDLGVVFPVTPSASSFPGFGSSLPSLGLMQETLEEQEERESKIKEQIRRSCPRSVIDDKLMLAGLSPDYQEQWAVTLIKVLFYPEELPGFSRSKSRFISFTVTDEGTSLIADQEVLSHFEEHMLNMSSSETMLRCIQVDLSTFGLDTYGLVYSMSNPLVDHGVNLLCLSTLKTANVLVHDSDLDMSLKILSMAGA
ncbi:GATS protein-like 3 [Mortierella sp. GBA30]|nr:GATS protein-like 3 [Mortierella sp. GBA30]